MRKSGVMVSFAFVFLMFPCAAIAEREDKIPPALQKKYDLRQQEMNSLDLNKDGIIDTQDYALALYALSFKYDEEITTNE